MKRKVRKVRTDRPDILEKAKVGLIDTTFRQFACGPCDNMWWRRCPDRKQVLELAVLSVSLHLLLCVPLSLSPFLSPLSLSLSLSDSLFSVFLSCSVNPLSLSLPLSLPSLPNCWRTYSSSFHRYPNVRDVEWDTTQCPETRSGVGQNFTVVNAGMNLGEFEPWKPLAIFGSRSSFDTMVFRFSSHHISLECFVADSVRWGLHLRVTAALTQSFRPAQRDEQLRQAEKNSQLS